jgi:hypothetical protein
VGTRLDDCQTCHKGGTFTREKNGRRVTVFNNACDYCHLIRHPAKHYEEPQPRRFAETLNPFGRDYLRAGASSAALQSIAQRDSDGDGHGNEAEIAQLKYPGDKRSRPGQRAAPSVSFTLDQLRRLRRHAQLLLVNSHQQRSDSYVHYQGVRVTTLLEAAGVDLTDPELQGITAIAPDGFLKDFTVEQITATYPAGRYHAGLDRATLGPACGFVRYPSPLPAGIDLAPGQPIPGEPVLMLGDRENGAPLAPCQLEIRSGRIRGDGPLRLVVPQSRPGKPDRGSSVSPTGCNDGYDYDEGKDHNAGAMVRGVVAIRVNPLPAGHEDFDHLNGGWALIDGRSLLVYGHGVKVAPAP